MEKIFGDIRSRIHNKEQISWKEVENLSEREDYHDVIKPYLASFTTYWKGGVIWKIHTLKELKRRIAIAPFGYFYMELQEDISVEFFQQEALLHLYGLEFQNWQARGIEYLNALSRAPYLQNLEVLDLAYSPIPLGNLGVIGLTKSSFLQNLTGLSLQGREIDDIGASILAKFPFSQKFTWLFLPGNPIGDRGKQALLESPYLQNCEIIFDWEEMLPAKDL